jgi:hypothetical protein
MAVHNGNLPGGGRWLSGYLVPPGLSIGLS